MGDGAGVLFVGFILGMVLAFALTIFFVPTLSEYPGLEADLSEQKDRCESRPNVISCEWDEDKATYIPKEQVDD